MSDNKHDFGYFGKGVDGYVHYNQSFEQNKKDGNFNSSSSSGDTENSGCLGLIGAAVILFFMYIFTKY